MNGWQAPWALGCEPKAAAVWAPFLADHFGAFVGPGVDDGSVLVDVESASACGRGEDIEPPTIPSQELPGALPGMAIRVSQRAADTWVLSQGRGPGHGARARDAPSGSSHPPNSGPEGTGLCRVTVLKGPRARVTAVGSPTAQLMWVALVEAYRVSGWLTVHGAAVVTDSGDYTLSLGRSGAGKSCLALQRGLAGSRFLGDDRIWLRATDGLMMARDRRVRLWGPMVDRIAPGRSGCFRLDDDGKHACSTAALGLETAPAGRVRRLEVLLGHRPGLPAGPAAAEGPAGRRLQVLQALWEALGTPFIPQAQQITQAAVQRLSGLPARLLARDGDGGWNEC